MTQEKWRDIESAPKTSKALLIWVPENKCVFAVTWGDGLGERPGWRIFGGDWRDYLQRATHYMPLPEPPTE